MKNTCTVWPIHAISTLIADLVGREIYAWRRPSRKYSELALFPNKGKRFYMKFWWFNWLKGFAPMRTVLVRYAHADYNLDLRVVLGPCSLSSTRNVQNAINCSDVLSAARIPWTSPQPSNGPCQYRAAFKILFLLCGHIDVSVWDEVNPKYRVI